MLTALAKCSPLVFALALATGCAGSSPPTWETQIADWREGQPIPDLALTDQDGRAFQLGRYRDDHVLVSFIYTGCDVAEACPMTMQRLAQVQRLWAQKQAAGDTKGQSLKLLSFTLDATNDTPDVLKAFATTHQVDPALWTLATGPEQLMVDKLPALFAVLALPDDGAINHSVKAALLGPGLVIETEYKDNQFNAEHVINRVLEK